jgi:hypothetical protein
MAYKGYGRNQSTRAGPCSKALSTGKTGVQLRDIMLLEFQPEYHKHVQSVSSVSNGGVGHPSDPAAVGCH